MLVGEMSITTSKHTRPFGFYIVHIILALAAVWTLLGQLCLSATIMPTEPPKVVARCGRGVLLDIAEQRVLLVAGSPYEMGYQQGRLLKGHIREVIDNILLLARAGDAQQSDDFFKDTLNKIWARAGKFIDQRYLEEMQGLAAGANISLEQVQLANIFPEQFHCSGFALLGKATVDGKLYHGRILDYMTEVGLQDHAVVTVAKPNGYHAFVTVGFAGFLGSVTGMNDQHVAIGEMGGRGQGQWDGMPMTFLLRKALEEADNYDQAVDLFRKTPRTCEYYYVISDGKNADAGGLACTGDTFDVIGLGQYHSLLTQPVADTVLLSAGKRYQYLVSLVNDRFGKIDLDYALDIMNRPVAMESCLHRVLFAPADLNLWVANAVNVTQEKYAACYQPYYKYDFDLLLELIPETIPASAEAVPKPDTLDKLDKSDKSDKSSNADVHSSIIESNISAGKQAEVISGSVSANQSRPLAPLQQGHVQSLLEHYNIGNEPFAFNVKLIHHTVLYDVYNVSFPSAYVSDSPENNTVYCEYYSKPGNTKRGVVILMDILDGSMIASRILANGLVSSGIDACILTLPHYGHRRSGDLRRLTDNPELLMTSVQQAVMDVRRTARWLAANEKIDEKRIGICGVSLGGFITALAAGVDGQFPRVAIILAGGDLASVLMSDAKEVRSIRQEIANRGLSIEEFREFLMPIEPLTFADRLGNTRLLMINGKEDPIVPAECATKLADATNAEIVWYNTDHYGMIKYTLPMLKRVTRHFGGQKW